MALLEDINRVALEYQTASRDSDNATDRFRFGVYFYRETPSPAGKETDE